MSRTMVIPNGTTGTAAAWLAAIEDGSAARLEAETAKVSGQPEASVAVLFKVASLIEALHQTYTEKSQHYTQAGIQAEFSRWPATTDAILYATRCDVVADRIEAQHNRSVDAEMAELSAPAKDTLSLMLLQERRAALAATDRVFQEQMLLMAAASGNAEDRQLLHAALSAPRPPTLWASAWAGGATAKVPGWPLVVSNELLKKIRAAIADRYSPQGESAFVALACRGMANRLRRNVYGGAGLSGERDALFEQASGKPFVSPFAEVEAAAREDRRWQHHSLVALR